MDNQTEIPKVTTDQSTVIVPLQSDNIVNPQVIPQPAQEQQEATVIMGGNAYSKTTNIPIESPVESGKLYSATHSMVNGRCAWCQLDNPSREHLESHVPTAGAPSKYKPEYCEKLIEHMSKGYSFDSFGAVVDVCEDTLYEWKKVHLAFSDSYKKGRTLSLYEWEKMGIHATQGKPFLYRRKVSSKGSDGSIIIKEVEEQGAFNATTWIFNMKNRFGWKDRKDFTTNDKDLPSNNLTDEQLDTVIGTKIRKAGITPAIAGEGTENSGQSA